MDFIFDIFYFVIVIAVLVTIHELGHFLAARMTGMRAEVFSVGMGKRLFGYNKLNGFTKGNLPENLELGEYTDYRLSLLPIGGYVKISGMIDESFDSEFVDSSPKDYEFRSKNTIQKAFVLSAGVIMNILLAVAVFTAIPYFGGDYVYSNSKIAYIQKGSIADAIGLREGDQVKSVNSSPINNWNDLLTNLTIKDLGDKKEIKVIRNEKEFLIEADGGRIIKDLAAQKDIGVDPIGLKTFFVDVPKDLPAQKAGFMPNDTIISINGMQVASLRHFMDIVSSKGNQNLTMTVKRGNEILKKNVTPGEDGKIGVVISNVYTGKITEINYSIGESLKIGYEQTLETVDLFFRSIKQIFAGNLSFKQSIGGPIMIAEQATMHAERGILSFLNFIALLSISLAIINILPFPALDGGHLVFVLIEGIARKEVPTKIKLGFQQGGVFLLLLFMIFVLYNDIMR